MDQTKTIHADGQSPLTQYLRFIFEVPGTLERVIDRDAEAVGILTAEPALPKVIERLDRRYWDRQLAERFGEIPKFPRIWTRRDEHWVNWILGRRFGWEPSRRLARYLNWLEPSVGVSHHDRLFQAAFNEARRDGTAAVVCPMLNQAYDAFDRHMKIARSILHDAGKRHELDESNWAVGDIVCQLVKYTKSRERDPTAGLVNDPTVNSFDDASNAPPLSETETSVQAETKPVKPKKSTLKGDAEAKIIPALILHHQYADGGSLNDEPIGNNELARQADVDKATASSFFKKHFGGHDVYKSKCANKHKLLNILKVLNGEYTKDKLIRLMIDPAKPHESEEQD
jgi:hypothetical protein